MKTFLLLLLLAVLVPAEIYSWIKYVNPFFWQPSIAYTDYAWGIVLVFLIFVSFPIAIIETICDINTKK